MGDRTMSQSSFKSAVQTHVRSSGPATQRGQDEARINGKLNKLVDPAEYGVIRRSLVRLDQRPDGLYLVTVGTPMPVEVRLDTTGSMGGNVEVALKCLPDTFELAIKMLPGFDLQMAIGIFGDCEDNFVLCRPQFEMEAEKLVEQLTLMNPEHGGAGNGGEDPHYGLFGAAYLTSAYINRIGLKAYDFTITDEPTRDQLSENQLIRIFGKDVFDKVKENGFEIDRHNLPSTKEVVQDLLKRAHAFLLEVEGWGGNMHSFWVKVFGPERVVILPNVNLLPQVQAVIIGLTEGTLGLSEVKDFLIDNKVSEYNTGRIAKSVSNIPIGAQAALRGDIKLPQKGDLFKEKTDLWPVDPNDVIASTGETDVVPEDQNGSATPAGPNWI